MHTATITHLFRPPYFRFLWFIFEVQVPEIGLVSSPNSTVLAIFGARLQAVYLWFNGALYRVAVFHYFSLLLHTMLFLSGKTSVAWCVRGVDLNRLSVFRTSKRAKQRRSVSVATSSMKEEKQEPPKKAQPTVQTLCNNPKCRYRCQTRHVRCENPIGP